MTSHEMQFSAVEVSQARDYEARLGLVGDVRVKLVIDHGSKRTEVRYGQAPEHTNVEQTGPFATCHTQYYKSMVAVIQKPDSRVGEFYELAFPEDSEGLDTFPKQRIVAIFHTFKALLLHRDRSTQQGQTQFSTITVLELQQCEMIESIAAQNSHVRIKDPFLDTCRTRKIESLDCILEEYFHFILQSTKRQFATIHRFSKVVVESVFSQKTDIAFSLPSAWPDETFDHFRLALHNAGYPKTTSLFSESKATVILHSAMHKTSPPWNKTEPEDSLKIVVDVGHRIATVSSVSIVEIGTRNIKVGEVIQGFSSLDGSHCLNEIFVDWPKSSESGWKENSHLFKLMSWIKGWNEQEVVRALSAGFDNTKRCFHETFDSVSMLLHPSIKGLNGFHSGQDLKSDGSTLKFNGHLMKTFVNQWMPRILYHVDEVVSSIRQKYPTRNLEIFSTGLGLGRVEDPSTYIAKQFKSHCDKLEIPARVVSRPHDGIGFGLWINLLSQNPTKKQYARTSFGVREGGCIKWIVKRGDNLSNVGDEDFKVEGALHLDDLTMSLDVALEILFSSNVAVLRGCNIDEELQKGTIRTLRIDAGSLNRLSMG